MASLSKLNNDYRAVLSELAQKRQDLVTANSAYSAAHARDTLNFVDVWYKKWGALYNGVKNEYHCPTLFSSGKKREDCTNTLRNYVDGNRTKYTNATSAMKSTTDTKALIETAIDDLEKTKLSLENQIKAAMLVEQTFADQGLSKSGVDKALETEARFAGEAKGEAIRLKAEADFERAKLSAEAKKNMNMLFLALGLIALVVIIVLVWRKFIKKKGGK